MDQTKILTYHGVRMDPFEPRPEDILLDDIAHALSMMTRANGHFRTFYSVGQHCLNCALEAKARGYAKMVQLFCLLHDATECYLSDLTRPVKRHFPLYGEGEAALEQVIYEKFAKRQPSGEERAQISAVDDCLLQHEFLTLRGEAIFEKTECLSASCDFSTRAFLEVEQDYLRTYRRLTGE